MKKYNEMLELFKQGKPAVVFDDEKRENEADIISPIALCDEQTINLMISEAKGLLCASLSPEIAHQKGFPLMSSNRTDLYSTAFTLSVDSRKVKTGISPYERCVTAKELIDSETTLKDFITPGHLFPLIAREGGVLQRRGHTEASVALCEQAGLAKAALICEMIKSDGNMYNREEAMNFAKKRGLPFFTIKEIIDHQKLSVKNVIKASSAKLKTDYGEFDIAIYKELYSDKEHIFLSMGDYKDGIVRIHSECFTGDVLMSRSCDCYSQLHDALSTIGRDGKGAIVYLRQEGRGIGLSEKIKAYHLQQNHNFDTVDANIELGHEPDERDFHQAAWILKENGFINVHLHSNNPHKKSTLERHGLKVRRYEGKICVFKENEKYLRTKKERLGHEINF